MNDFKVKMKNENVAEIIAVSERAKRKIDNAYSLGVEASKLAKVIRLIREDGFSVVL